MKIPALEISGDDYCWDRIGTLAPGQPSCPKLKELVHCRNCEDFQSQAGLLLKSPPPPGYAHEWETALAECKEKNVKLSESLLVFRLEGQWLALPTATVKEVAKPAKVHRLPRKSDNVLLGIVNFRGRLQLCFSLHALLGIETVPVENDRDRLFGQRLVEVEVDGFHWVFSADEILDVCRYDLDDVANLPSTVAGADINYIHTAFTYQGNTVGCLDVGLVAESLNRRLI